MGAREAAPANAEGARGGASRPARLAWRQTGDPVLPAWADRPSVVAALAGVSALVYVVVRLEVVAHGRIAGFVTAGRQFVDLAKAPKGLSIASPTGYDGQFFYRLALDPANLHKTAYGVTIDTPFRLQRIGYPALSWLTAFGHRPWVPTSLVLVNLAAIVALGYLGALLARDAGRHALWGLMLAFYFGFVFSIGRDTAEPVAAALMLVGVFAYRRGRPILAGLAFAAGGLTRETVLIAVVALAATRLFEMVTRRARPGRLDLAWVIPPAVFVAWQLVVRSVTGVLPYRSDTQSAVTVPFKALLKYAYDHLLEVSPHAVDPDGWVLEMVVLGVLVGAALLSLPSTTVPGYERVAFVLYTAQVTVLSSAIWNDFADLRQIDELYVFSVLVLIGSPRRSMWKVALLLLPALLYATAHRAALP